MIIDLHIHTKMGSSCSQLGPDELLERARELGLDAVCITDHHSHRGADRMIEYARGSGFPVFRGVEIFTEMGDMLVFGMKRDTKYHLTTFQELEEMADKDHAVIIHAHPCRGWNPKRERKHIYPRELVGRITAMETHNGGNTQRSNEWAGRISEELGIPGVGGSDAHMVSQVGKCVTVFERDIQDEAELISELKAGRFYPAYLEDLSR